MKQKNDVDNYGQELEDFKDDIQIEYNDDFTSEKTKSLNKFPLKIITSNEFFLDDMCNNFSKSLNFNFNKCFAPKPKFKQSSRNPTPIIFEKQTNISNLNTQDHIITEDAYSEKEVSLDNDSCSSEDENQNDEINNSDYKKDFIIKDIEYNDQNINDKYIISKNLLIKNKEKKSEDQTDLYENNINIIEDEKENKNVKIYGHKTINIFPFKNNCTKGNLKSIRNSLFRAKMKSLKAKNREVEYSIKDRAKIKYGLNLINNKSKKIEHNHEICNVIPINNNEKNEEEKEDINNFRKTISFKASKLNLENKPKKDDKGITIYDVLITNKKNKNENS